MTELAAGQPAESVHGRHPTKSSVPTREGCRDQSGSFKAATACPPGERYDRAGADFLRAVSPEMSRGPGRRPAAAAGAVSAVGAVATCGSGET